MPRRVLSSLATIIVLSSGCALTSAEPLRAEVEADTNSDPRERNAWFAEGRRNVARASRFVAGERAAKNVILFVGDGMGISTVTAARILEGQRRGEPGEENQLAFEALPHVAFSKTYNTDAQVSDSASTITAIVSGVKTKTGVLGLDERVRRGDPTSVEASSVVTILEEAENRGLATGIVSTASITHATPAGCYAHAPLRSWMDDSRLTEQARKADFPDIARQLVEFPHGDGLEVALGGGRRHFTPEGTPDPENPEVEGARTDGQDLTKLWVEAREGSSYVWNRDGLLAVDLAESRHLLGLFEPGHMKFEADRASDEGGEPAIAEMTAIAIELLQKDPDGFFLMVEGGRIDHGHHAGNAYRALTDTIAMSDAVRVALEETNPEDTLIVVTADHSHTLVISGYPKRGNPILGKVVSLSRKSEGEGEVQVEVAHDANEKPYTTLSYANGPGYAADKGRPDLADVETEDPAYLQEATVPLRSETHAGEDVPIYAGGPRAGLFHGVQEQSYIYHAMVEAFGWTRAGIPVD